MEIPVKTSHRVDLKERSTDKLLQTPARVLLAALPLILMIGGRFPSMALAQTCGPFGDPPAKVTAAPKPLCPKGDLLGPLNDSNDTPRYACLYEPPSASTGTPLPLLVFLPGFGATADEAVKSTNLLQFLNSANVSDNPSKPGFILLSVQPRRLVPTYMAAAGLSNTNLFDTTYRQYSPAGSVTAGGTVYPENADAGTIDQFVAEEVSTGEVDTGRIYVIGWDVGGSAAYLYGLNRPNIAAVGGYVGTNPFFFVGWDPCPQLPVDGSPATIWQAQVFNPTLPVYQIANDCSSTSICADEQVFAADLMPLGTAFENVIIDAAQNQVTQCNYACNDIVSSDASSATGAGLKNDSRWPANWTGPMLDFLRTHPLGSNPPQPTRTESPLG